MRSLLFKQKRIKGTKSVFCTMVCLSNLHNGQLFSTEPSTKEFLFFVVAGFIPLGGKLAEPLPQGSCMGY